MKTKKRISQKELRTRIRQEQIRFAQIFIQKNTLKLERDQLFVLERGGDRSV